MTEPMEVIKHAIRLPNGQLCHDLPGDVKAGYPQLETLPSGVRAYLWPEDEAHNARNTVLNIGRQIKHWGADEVWIERAEVVQVRVTAVILDGTERGVETVAARTWDRVEDIPSNVPFRVAGDRVYRRSDLTGTYVLVGGDQTFTARDFCDHSQGFVEALPEQPRTWPKAQDVPVGVGFKGVPSGTTVWRNCEDLTGEARADGGRWATHEALEQDYPDGFVEVLP